MRGLPSSALLTGLAGLAMAGCGPGPDSDGGPPMGAPPTVFLTTNDIPRAMNGTVPFTAVDGALTSFTLTLPLAGFTLDLVATEGDGKIDVASLSVRCDAAVGGGAPGGRAAGEELADLFEAPAALAWTWSVEATLGFEATPPGTAITCVASVGDVDGRVSPQSALPFATAPLDPLVHPFDVDDVWVLDFTRDLFAVAPGVTPGGAYTIDSVDGANGVPDYLEEMTVIGLQGTEAAPGAATLVAGPDLEVGVNAIVARAVRRALLARVRGFYHQAPDGSGGADAVPAAFVLDDDPGAPDPIDFTPDGGFSLMGIGGEGTPADRLVPFFGKAELDPRNEVRNDDSVYGLGVFTTTALRAVLSIELAGVVLAPFIPALGGTAIGDDPGDPIFLADGFDPAAAGVDPVLAERADRFTLLLDLLMKALAALTAHEIGHSLGLDPDGPPPRGLFGGEALAEFAGPLTTSAHLDVTGLNLMASGGGGAGLNAGAGSLFEEPFFTPLELAYLRARLLVLP